MAEACVTDTTSVNLGFDVGQNLTATLIVDPAGAIITGASGVKVQLDATPGLEIAADKLRAKVQGGGIVRGANGLAKINQASNVGWNPGDASGFVALSQNVSRGATADIATAIAISIVNSADQTQRFLVQSTWGIDYQTTFGAFETSNVFDAVYLQLVRSFNAGTYVAVDFDGIPNSTQSRRVVMKNSESIGVAGNTTVTYAIKPQSIGGTASATAIQGHIKGRFAAGITLYW